MCQLRIVSITWDKLENTKQFMPLTVAYTVSFRGLYHEVKVRGLGGEISFCNLGPHGEV